MAYVKYTCEAYHPDDRRRLKNLLRKRLRLRDRRRYHESCIKNHQAKILELETDILPGLDKEIDSLLSQKALAQG